jgi:hypothetical protein
MLLALNTPLGAAEVSTGCRTPLGVPCHTIRYRLGQWALFHRGMLDVTHSTVETVAAVRSDGSMCSGSRLETYALFKGKSYGAPSSTIYSAPTGRVIRIFPNDRTFSSRAPLIWHDRPYRRSKDGDSTCSTGILHQGTDFKHAGTEVILGLQAAHWHRELGNGGYEDSYLAPALDCAALRHKSVHKSALHLPAFITSSEVTGMEWGEPDARLFMVPAEYREIQDPGLPGLMRYLSRRVSSR